jgi:putative hydrolase of the HAD superfamily
VSGARPLRFVLFDYGNTLVPYGRNEASVVDRVVAEAVARRAPGLDPGVFAAAAARVKDDLIRGTRATGREVSNEDFARALSAAAGLPRIPGGLAEELEERVGEAFVRVLRLPPDTLPVLDSLAERHRLGLVSNYYLPGPLRRSLERFGIAGRLGAAVVSGEVGWVKPRPEPFREALRLLGADPAECVFVGDNLHADVGGASALGMRTVHLREWIEDALPADRADAEGGPRPDRVLDRLADLPAAVASLEGRCREGR